MTHEDMVKRLADIVPPTPPEWDWWLVSTSIGLSICVMLVLVLLYSHMRSRQHPHAHITSPAAEAQAKLTELAAQWRQGNVTDREAAYRLSTALRLGLGLDQLAPHIEHPAMSNHKMWIDTLALLQQLRYQNHASKSLTPTIFNNAASWLATARALEQARHV